MKIRVNKISSFMHATSKVVSFLFTPSPQIAFYRTVSHEPLKAAMGW
jgi:hypothetical protein